MAPLDKAEEYLQLWINFYRKARLKFELSYKGKNARKRFRWNDQRALRNLHQEQYPRMKVDTLTKVFSRNDEFLHEL